MHYVLGFVISLLKRGPLTLGAVAVAILGAGFYLQIGENERTAARLAAIEAGPPPVVEITKFDEDRDMTGQREVVVRAQPVIEHAYRLTYSENSGDDYAFMVPLLGTNATNSKVVFGIAFYHSRDFTFDDITPDLMLNGVTDFGDYGPIVDYNGRVSSLGKWQDMTDEAFIEQGLTLDDNAVIVWPYLDGRTAALTPSDLTIFDFFSYIAGALGLLALGKLVIGKNPEDTPTGIDRSVTPVTPHSAAFDPIPPANAADAMPLWKQRAEGKFETLFSEFETSPSTTPETATSTAPTFDAAPAKAMTRAEALAQRQPNVQPPLIAPKRSGLGVRKVLIGIVGALFMLGLVSTVTDLVAKSSTVPAVTSQDIAAATVADVLVPDADPDRHWTDIDVTPVIEWVVAKSILAAAGDVDAMTTLGMIFGGAFIAMFMLRVYITARLTSTLGRRRSYDFDDLKSGG